MRKILFLVIGLIVPIWYFACTSTDSHRYYEKVVADWLGKEILFPDSLHIINGEKLIDEVVDFLIVSYYDSTGCTSCRMKLSFWEDFMARIDSAVSPRKVQLVMVASIRNIKSLSNLIRKESFHYPIIQDEMGIIDNLNSFPKESELQTFLIDRNRKVLAIGNPINSQAVERLYLEIMLNQPLQSDYDTTTLFNEYDFGSVKSMEEVSHVFHLENSTIDTLKVKDILTSCECTEAFVSTKLIPPQQKYTVKVTFRDSVEGDFLRTVKVKFGNCYQDIQFELTGTIVK